jgi:hypothetical protein
LASNSPKASHFDQNSVPNNVAATEVQQPNLNVILEETEGAGQMISGDLDDNIVSKVQVF